MKPPPTSMERRLYREVFGHGGLPLLLLGRWMPGRFLVRIRPPGAKRPVRLRLGTTDIRSFLGAFHRRHYLIDLSPEPEVIFDVGANVGLTSIYFARRFKKARVFAIEPERRNFELLKRNVRRYRRIEPVRAALWSRNEPLSVVNEGADSDAYQVGRSIPGGSMSVSGKTLDRLMEETGVEHIDLLKVDIEGAEREVFAGVPKWIDRVDALIVELHDFLMSGCEGPVLDALRGFEYLGRRRIHLMAVRERRRLAKVPRHFTELNPGLSQAGNPEIFAAAGAVPPGTGRRW